MIMLDRRQTAAIKRVAFIIRFGIFILTACTIFAIATGMVGV